MRALGTILFKVNLAWIPPNNFTAWEDINEIIKMPSAKTAKAKFPGRSMAQNGRFKPRKSTRDKVSKDHNLAAKKIQAEVEKSKKKRSKENSETVMILFCLHFGIAWHFDEFFWQISNLGANSKQKQ